MKTLIIITLAALLSACGGGEAVFADKEIDRITITRTDAPVKTEAPTVAPTPTKTEVICDATTFIPCDNRPAPVQTPVTSTPPDGYELCDAWSYNPCQAPTWIPKQPK